LLQLDAIWNVSASGDCTAQVVFLSVASCSSSWEMAKYERSSASAGKHTGAARAKLLSMARFLESQSCSDEANTGIDFEMRGALRNAASEEGGQVKRGGAAAHAPRSVSCSCRADPEIELQNFFLHT